MDIEYTTWELFGNELIRLGTQGENDTQALWIDVSTMISIYPDAVFAIRVENPEGVPYNATQVTLDGDYLQWVYSESDTAVSGYGFAQVIAYGSLDGQEIAKTPRARTIVSSSIGSPDSPPDPMKEWLDEAQRVLEALKQLEGVGSDGIEAATAKKLKTAREIAIAGEAVGAAMFDGSEDIKIMATIERLTNEDLEVLLK